MRALTIIMTAIAALSLACSTSPSGPAEPQGDPRPGTYYPLRGIAHWSDFSYWDEGTTAEAARAGLIILPIERCFSPASADIISRLRELNPDVKILGYLGMLVVGELYPDTTYLASQLPWELEFYRKMEDRWAWTVTGDTFHVWPGRIFIDPIDEDGEPDHSIIEDITEMLERYTDQWPGTIDGIMHDYFMYQPYVSPYNDNVDGGIDLDGNGILIGEDESERAVFLRWQKDYAAAIRDRLGRDFIQIANGKVPQDDAELAGELNGIFYEYFPNMCWSLTDRAGFEKLLENQADGYLAEAHGRTWSILTHNSIEYNNMFCMLSGLLAGCFHTELQETFLFRGWSIEVEAGLPLSGLTVEGKPDSILTYRRSFTGGEASISFGPNGGRRDWTFTPTD